MPSVWGRSEVLGPSTLFLDKGDSAMLISGTTSKKELCLVSRAEHSGARFLAVEPCEDAVLEKDGREIWQLSPGGRIADLAGRCLAAESGELLLRKCQDAQAWRLTGKNQIQLGEPAAGTDRSCLAVDPAVTLMDGIGVDLARGQTAESTSSTDMAHSAGNAVDGNPATYWASDILGQDSAADGPVSWSVSFPRSRLNSVDIEWEHAAQQFDLQISNGDDSWQTVYSVPNNPLNSRRSRIPLDGIEAQAVKLVFGGNLSVPAARRVGIRHFRLTSASVTRLPMPVLTVSQGVGLFFPIHRSLCALVRIDDEVP
ncbi:hypothetical protein AK812_SmicGene10046 [Symbiodinium microadriaticum]|uniref:Uncharacterized protein n=1 Tax=Symbiodinium microadriaticum TaxID=2951 RepID=A0A1Q9EGZ7_SYMMI|nr:hypothetical protein AK812_SmicGene10046 [Symbiodinium microadriaticum]CAE7930384.1 unnamed protein product [Symbiodinium sp. KB8]